MDELPDEVLEFIFWRISPYVDFKNIKLVSRRWYYVVKRALFLLYKLINNYSIRISNQSVEYFSLLDVIECRILRFETAALRGSVAWRVERATLSGKFVYSNKIFYRVLCS